MSSAFAVTAPEHQSLWQLQSLMLNAEHLHPQDSRSRCTFYAYKTQQEATRFAQLLIQCGILEHKNPEKFLVLCCERFCVLLQDAARNKIYSKVDYVLRALREQELLECQTPLEDLGNLLLLNQLIQEATKTQIYVGHKPSGMFYACNDKEKANHLAQLLLDCGVLKDRDAKQVAQHCLERGEKRFGIILTDQESLSVQSITGKILASEVGNVDFVGLLRQNAQKTRAASGEICYQFADQKMALIVSRSLFIKLNIGKDAKHPKEVVQESGHFVITLTELEARRIK